MKLVLATADPNKAREIREILQDRVSLIPRPQDVPSPVENGGTLLVNVATFEPERLQGLRNWDAKAPFTRWHNWEF
jgi:inosine/xanthosine triphosphate pyrophosphatase family protein